MLLLAFPTLLTAQTDVWGDFQEDPNKKLAEKEFVTATFKATRLINFHTVEVGGKKGLDFRISHRFGELNGGAYNFFGLDGGASIRIALEYSPDNRIQFGLGRTSSEKQLDGFVKYRAVRQTVDDKTPLSITLLGSTYFTMLRDTAKYKEIAHRLSYGAQVIIARKFSKRLSAQLSPTFLHYNLVKGLSDPNSQFVLGASGRYKFNGSSAITAEYGYVFNPFKSAKYYNSLGIGIDIETGGHVFQMHFTNSFGLTENQYLSRTTTTWTNWGIRLGFNISRMFTIGARH